MFVLHTNIIQPHPSPPWGEQVLRGHSKPEKDQMDVVRMVFSSRVADRAGHCSSASWECLARHTRCLRYPGLSQGHPGEREREEEEEGLLPLGPWCIGGHAEGHAHSPVHLGLVLCWDTNGPLSMTRNTNLRQNHQLFTKEHM